MTIVEQPLDHRVTAENSQTAIKAVKNNATLLHNMLFTHQKTRAL